MVCELYFNNAVIKSCKRIIDVKFRKVILGGGETPTNKVEEEPIGASKELKEGVLAARWTLRRGLLVPLIFKNYTT